jgi:hypothetical protein
MANPTNAVTFTTESDWICRSDSIFDGDVELVFWFLPPIDFVYFELGEEWIDVAWAVLNAVTREPGPEVVS